MVSVCRGVGVAVDGKQQTGAGLFIHVTTASMAGHVAIAPRYGWWGS